jgi:Bacterial regulatory proteins, gntR family
MTCLTGDSFAILARECCLPFLLDEQNVRQIRISDQVADYILHLIVDEGLGPGDELPSESELARRLDVMSGLCTESASCKDWGAGRGAFQPLRFAAVSAFCPARS